ncbi:MAG: hypothetical protein HKN27_04655 [Silicimonas sp.]|nr:hypothetical protein [Silicimonas sp.]
MTTPTTFLQSLNRPQLLVRAAQVWLPDFNRDRSMRRIFPGMVPPTPGRGFEALIEQEQAIDQIRREGAASYSAARHIEVLVALIVEARLASALRIAA